MKKYAQLPLIVFAFLVGSLISSLTTVAVVHALGSSDLINGCVASNGTLKISANGTCGSNETPLTWNARGLPGTGALVENLHGASINSTDFSWRTLKDDDFSGTGCGLSGDTFNHTDLTNVNVTGCGLTASNFLNQDTTSVTMGNNSLDRATISNSNFSSRNLSGDNIDNASITYTNLTNANLSGIALGLSHYVDFSNSTVSGTNFTGLDCSVAAYCTLNGVTGSNTNFTNANLTNATFNGATLTTPIWSNTTCPDGTNSNSNGGTCSGHGGGL